MTAFIPITWAQVEESIDTIAGRIKRDLFQVDAIVAIGRGGMVPAVLLSHRLGNVRVFSFETIVNRHAASMAQYVFGDLLDAGQRVLIIDDINDSGHTFLQTQKSVKDHSIRNPVGYHNVRYAALITNDNSGFQSLDYAGSHISKECGDNSPWYIFPWETNESTETST